MRKLKTFCALIFLALVCNCTSRNNIANIGVVDANENIIAVDVDSNEPEYAAMYQLLFRGIPNSSQQTPLIKVSESAAINSNPAYFEVFFKKQRYKTFITSSTKNNDSSQRIVINLKALRLDLESNTIIRKFGY